ncbi:MAG TPA: trypsin-like peptidase domain-containing protein [Micromonosporaceae bacterium]
MTDASGWRQAGGDGPGQPSPWWSDALTDPWRDPRSPAVVVRQLPATAPDDAAPLEQVDTTPPRHRLGLVFVVAVVTALLAGALGGTLGFVFATRTGTAGGRTPIGASGSAPALAQRAPDSLAAAVHRVLPSVVTVRVGSTSGYSLGSGFIVSADGYVVTNDHVISGASGTATVVFGDSSTAVARIVGRDEESDIGVLKVDRSGLPPVQFGDSDALAVGDPVIAVGSPLALTNTVTAGIVSALNRPVEASEEGGPTRYYAAIQTDAAVNHGNSGGPLVDSAGRVIGVNAVIKSLASNSDEAGNIGLAFAIPINQAKRIAQDIIDTGKARRTVLGAQLDTAYRNINGGVRLLGVEPGGPAAGAGLKAGDVVLRIDGQPVEEPGDVIALIRKYPPGATVTVDYQRGGANRAAEVRLVADAK